ncbi:MAG: hypothetical protein AB2L14_25245 [Candidatus Xenobiia bacterium LiM19]
MTEIINSEPTEIILNNSSTEEVIQSSALNESVESVASAEVIESSPREEVFASQVVQEIIQSSEVVGGNLTINNYGGDAHYIQGRAVSTDVPADNEALKWNNTTKKWEPGQTVGDLMWAGNEVSSATQMVSGNGYLTNNVSRVTLTLPATATVGQKVGVQGKGAGGWKIQANSGQVIHLEALETIAGGYVNSSHYKVSCTLLCITENTDWAIFAPTGKIKLQTS